MSQETCWKFCDATVPEETPDRWEC